MAETFLNQLPRVGRDVLEKEDQRCFICMEEYGSAPSKNGVIEHAVKLECGHIMGSECIAIWVLPTHKGGSGNNTCPVCRHELFGEPISSWLDSDHMRVHNLLWIRIVTLCAMLELSVWEVGRTAKRFADAFHHRETIREEDERDDDRPVHAVAAASVYLACHLLEQPRSLEMIADCFNDVEVDAIRRAYTVLHGYCYLMLNPQLVARLADELPSPFL